MKEGMINNKEYQDNFCLHFEERNENDCAKFCLDEISKLLKKLLRSNNEPYSMQECYKAPLFPEINL